MRVSPGDMDMAVWAGKDSCPTAGDSMYIQFSLGKKKKKRINSIAKVLFQGRKWNCLEVGHNVFSLQEKSSIGR
jgi:hypothetical protein